MTDRPAAGRVDAHHHLWDLAARDQPWIDPVQMPAIRRRFDTTDLIRALADSQIASTVLVQVLNRADETDELLDIAVASNLIGGVVAWADLSGAGVADEIARLRERGPLVGIRHQLQAESAPADWLQRSEIGTGLRQVERAGLAFDLMVRPEQFAAATAVVRAHPGLSFVVDHLGKPPIASRRIEPWATGLQLLAREPNVAAKLSGLVTVADHRDWSIADLRPYVDMALAAFGPARLMFGSDWPVCLLAAEYGDVARAVESLVAALSPDEQRDVWAGTARRVYSIG